MVVQYQLDQGAVGSYFRTVFNMLPSNVRPKCSCLSCEVFSCEVFECR